MTDAERRRELKAAYRRSQGSAAAPRPLHIRVVAILLALTGVGLLVLGQVMAGASKDWPVVDATVLAAEVRSHRPYYARSPGSLTHTPTLRYAYTFDGEAHESSRIHLCDLFNGTSYRPDAEAFLRGRQPGTSIRVRVWPRYPSVAVLNDDEDQATTFPFIAGAFLILLGLVARFARPAAPASS